MLSDGISYQTYSDIAAFISNCPAYIFGKMSAPKLQARKSLVKVSSKRYYFNYEHSQPRCGWPQWGNNNVVNDWQSISFYVIRKYMDVCRISQEKSGWILLMILNEIIHFLGELLDCYVTDRWNEFLLAIKMDLEVIGFTDLCKYILSDSK